MEQRGFAAARAGTRGGKAPGRHKKNGSRAADAAAGGNGIGLARRPAIDPERLAGGHGGEVIAGSSGGPSARQLLVALTALKKGDFSVRLPIEWEGVSGKIADTFNEVIELNDKMAKELDRLSRMVGKEGRITERASIGEVSGAWADTVASVNDLVSDLVHPTSETARVIGAVAKGDLSQTMALDVGGRPLRGELLRTAKTVNTMVDQLGSFASEVTRVAREVGTEGKLGGQAEVKGVAGTWKDLTDNVNFMAGNLTNQVRGIANLVTAIARGDLKRKLAVEAKGEIAALADTVNGMIDTLATFADQVTTVAREVGVEGKLGGQASVPGAAGTWKDLTDNVNRLAANLTTQVRAIAEVATAVTKGDLTRSIKVEAQGEVAALKDNINEMIRNLKDTTLKNSEQDWLKTNLAKFSRMLQGQKDLLTVGRLILSELAPVVSAQQGVFYTMDAAKDDAVLKLLASYAYRERKSMANCFKLGEGLVGQCALEKEKILLTNVPRDYLVIASGLGEAPPLNIIVMPVLFEGQVKAVLELASFERFSPTHQAFLDQLTESIGIVLNTIEANMRTEDLLKQSQSLARELQSQQEELQQTNAELGEKARLLAEQNVEVERKNREVEQARQALEEKARQLALTSKYKSEFLANMSHELRTPLNSLLILSDQLSRNPESNLTQRQVEFARTIHSSGNDLLALINDILDLSKIESGTVIVDVGEVWFRDLAGYVERTFRHVAEAKRLAFALELSADLPRALYTDAKRLQQVLKNLLSNAFKFTERGSVSLEVAPAQSGWSLDNESLNRARSVVALAVRDTGIGIHPDKQQIIFEAFQQADGSTSRKYGGTGLGLAISRELARLLGGELRLVSTPGAGSVFTLYLPQTIAPPRPRRPHDVDAPRALEVGSALASSPAWDPRALPPAEPRDLPVGAWAREEAAGGALYAIDDSAGIRPDDHVLLIVENDHDFLRFLLDGARDNGFKGVVARHGGAALSLARELMPRGITLDIKLPDIDGWRVLRQLKEDTTTRHIPVHVISTADERERGLRMGARGVLAKPVKTREQIDQVFAKMREHLRASTRSLLLVEPDEERRRGLLELLGGSDVTIRCVATGAEAIAVLEASRRPAEGGAPGEATAADGALPDVLVAAARLPDMRGPELVAQVGQRLDAGDLPAIVYELNTNPPEDEALLAGLTDSRVFRYARGTDRLFDDVMLHLHRPLSAMPPSKRAIIERLHPVNAVLAGRKVLIVDDDIRNIFALTTLLEPHDMVVVSAETGSAAIDIVRSSPDVDIVLMDIMMPDMDGYDTIRTIRKDERSRSLPIVALTAKAMKGDREKCIEAGATDYVSKPVDPEQLLRVLRVWLHR